MRTKSDLSIMAGIAAVIAAIPGCSTDLSLKHGCRTSADCVSGICYAGTCQQDDERSPNLVFVTSRSFPIRFSPLSDADALCDAAARSAGRRGEFRAWLSTSGVSAFIRLA